MYNIIIEQNKGANNPEERIPCYKKKYKQNKQGNKQTNKQTNKA